MVFTPGPDGKIRTDTNVPPARPLAPEEQPGLSCKNCGNFVRYVDLTVPGRAFCPNCGGNPIRD